MSEKKQNSALIFIFITLLIDVTGFGVIIPIFPELLKELVHGDLSEASNYSGWLTFSYAVMQFIFSPVLGALSDRYGRRPVLLFSLFGFGADYILQGFANTIELFFVGRIIAGITGASFTTASAYIADISEPEKRAQNFGVIGAAFGLGFIIGPALGGFLGQFGPRVPFFAAAGLTIINFIYGYFILPESLSLENRRKFEWKRANPVGSLAQLKRYPVIISLVASLVLIYIAGHAAQSTWTFFTIEKFKWGPKLVGISLAFVGLMVAIVQGFLTRIVIPKIGKKLSVYVGLMFYAIGLICFAFATESWMMFAFIIPYSLGGFAGPSLQAIISGQVPANEQGELQGALTSLISVTSIIGPLLMTGLFSYFTHEGGAYYFPGAPFVMGAVLSLLSLLMAIRSLSKLDFQDS